MASPRNFTFFYLALPPLHLLAFAIMIRHQWPMSNFRRVKGSHKISASAHRYAFPFPSFSRTKPDGDTAVQLSLASVVNYLYLLTLSISVEFRSRSVAYINFAI